MTKIIIAILITVTLAVFGINWYLQPNDLAQCGKTPSVKEKCQMVDAVIAISGGDTSARADWAINLYKNGWSRILIFSGAASDKSGPSNAVAMKRLAIKSGVPAEKIYIDEDSETTGENARNVVNMFKEHRINKAILVTSGYHQRRASLEFRKYSSDAFVLNSPVLIDKDWSFWWWTTPRGWWLALSELVKIVIFFMAGV